MAFDLFVNGVTRRGRVSVTDRVELEHEAVREVDELEEQAVGVWGEGTWHETISNSGGGTGGADCKVSVLCGLRRQCGLEFAGAALAQQPLACHADSGDSARGIAAAAVLTRLPPTCPVGYKDVKRRSVSTANEV